MMVNIRIEESSGNVFVDLGFPHSDQELIKAKLTYEGSLHESAFYVR